MTRRNESAVLAALREGGSVERWHLRTARRWRIVRRGDPWYGSAFVDTATVSRLHSLGLVGKRETVKDGVPTTILTTTPEAADAR